MTLILQHVSVSQSNRLESSFYSNAMRAGVYAEAHVRSSQLRRLINGGVSGVESPAKMEEQIHVDFVQRRTSRHIEKRAIDHHEASELAL